MTFREHIKLCREDSHSREQTLIAKAQAECGHPDVAHWSGNELLNTYHPMRLCLECGLVEQGSWWSDRVHWRKDDGVSVLAKPMTVKEVAYDTLRSLLI